MEVVALTPDLYGATAAGGWDGMDNRYKDRDYLPECGTVSMLYSLYEPGWDRSMIPFPGGRGSG
ncbi:MAG TPA: hypothetical protein PLC40_14970 [Candidatus Hydrogenedentes bacterium]|nr:hypothetical protein [Candidatus Hydrogenedentota bacterium]